MTESQVRYYPNTSNPFRYRQDYAGQFCFRPSCFACGMDSVGESGRVIRLQKNLTEPTATLNFDQANQIAMDHASQCRGTVSLTKIELNPPGPLDHLIAEGKAFTFDLDRI
jgi:hypothetical protein